MLNDFLRNKEEFSFQIRMRLSDAKANVKYFENWQKQVDDCYLKFGKCSSDDEVIAKSRQTNLTNEKRVIELCTELLKIHGETE